MGRKERPQRVNGLPEIECHYHHVRRETVQIFGGTSLFSQEIVGLCPMLVNHTDITYILY